MAGQTNSEDSFVVSKIRCNGIRYNGVRLYLRGLTSEPVDEHAKVIGLKLRRSCSTLFRGFFAEDRLSSSS